MTVVSQPQRRMLVLSQDPSEHPQPSRSRSARARRAVTGLAVLLTGIALLAGCAAGQHAQTVGQRPAIDGVSADSGTVGIRSAAIAAPDSGASYATGASAKLQLILINNGTADDKLVSVASAAASGGLLSTSTTSDSATSAAPTASATSAASQPNTVPSQPITVPANSSVSVGFGGTGASITLQPLTAALFPAQSVPVTFTFASGASISVNLPVALSTSGPSAPSIDIAPPGQG
jgi:copper(I)-binding protein